MARRTITRFLVVPMIVTAILIMSGIHCAWGQTHSKKKSALKAHHDTVQKCVEHMYHDHMSAKGDTSYFEVYVSGVKEKKLIVAIPSSFFFAPFLDHAYLLTLRDDTVVRRPLYQRHGCPKTFES